MWWGGGMRGRGACVVEWGACKAGAMHVGVRGRKNGNCSGRYASYWNAFLFSKYFKWSKLNSGS